MEAAGVLLALFSCPDKRELRARLTDTRLYRTRTVWMREGFRVKGNGWCLLHEIVFPSSRTHTSTGHYIISREIEIGRHRARSSRASYSWLFLCLRLPIRPFIDLVHDRQRQ